MYVHRLQKVTKKKSVNKLWKKDECVKYALLAALHHQEISNNPERISNVNLLLINIAAKNQTSCITERLEKSWKKKQKTKKQS